MVMYATPYSFLVHFLYLANGITPFEFRQAISLDSLPDLMNARPIYDRFHFCKQFPGIVDPRNFKCRCKQHWQCRVQVNSADGILPGKEETKNPDIKFQVKRPVLIEKAGNSCMFKDRPSRVWTRRVFTDHLHLYPAF